MNLSINDKDHQKIVRSQLILVKKPIKSTKIVKPMVLLFYFMKTWLNLNLYSNFSLLIVLGGVSVSCARQGNFDFGDTIGFWNTPQQLAIVLVDNGVCKVEA
jgi:hypothetical protein